VKRPAFGEGTRAVPAPRLFFACDSVGFAAFRPRAIGIPRQERNLKCRWNGGRVDRYVDYRQDAWIELSANALTGGPNMRCFQIETFGEPLRLADLPVPVLTGTQVALRTRTCGVCHSDIHLADGYFDLGDGQRVDLSRGLKLPLVPGHEIVGEVIALGPDATGVQVGDRRIVYPWIGCGTCGFCTSGDEQLCSRPCALGVNTAGGYGEAVTVPHSRYLLDFAPLDDAQACILACSGLTAFGALRKALPFPPAGPLLIIGAGGVGLSAIRMAKAVLGAAPIVAEIDRAKWDVARDAGAADCIDPSEAGAGRTLLKATGGIAAAIDFVGAGDSFAFGLEVLAKTAKLIVVGLLGGSTRISPALLPLKAVTIMGSYVGSLQEMHDLLHLARSGLVPLMPLTERPLDDANTVLDELRQRRVRGRVVLRHTQPGA
jgi:alcohol dehydrogenase/propanol-preferring alcohol dehydrogenase